VILAGTRATLEVTVYVDGTATDPSSAGTVTVRDASGATLSSGAAVIAGGNSGTLRYTPSAEELADVNRLRISWEGVVVDGAPAITLETAEEVVGELLFTEAEARAFDAGALSNATVYPDAAIREGHDRIMDAFEAIIGYPLGRRYQSEVLDGQGGTKARLSRGYVQAIRSVEQRSTGTQTWAAWSAGDVEAITWRRWGLIEREAGGVFASGTRNYRIEYEAGKPISLELRRAALRVLRNQLVKSNLSDRALYETNELGQFRLAVAGEGARWFGIPEVDAVLLRAQERSIW
jgi:hypothetical protein